MKDKMPAFITKLLANPPLLADEHREEFRELFEIICADEDPQSFQEWVIVGDIACEVWELLRLRSLKVRVLHVNLLDSFVQERAVGSATQMNFPRPKPPWLTEFRRDLIGLIAGDAAAKQRLEKRLASEGFSLDSIVAASFARKIATQLSADKLVEAAYRRRNALHADLGRLRAHARRREKLPPIVDAPSLADGNEKAISRPEVGESPVEGSAGERESTAGEQSS
jgi:hypothetical protein